MNPLEPPAFTGQEVTINWLDRWQVYQRLQELQIPCSCATNQPLRVEINSVTQAMQLRSVLKQINCSRQELQQWVQHCWQLGS